MTQWEEMRMILRHLVAMDRRVPLKKLLPIISENNFPLLLNSLFFFYFL